MSSGKIAITPLENGVVFEVAGRANFETAMPLREYAEKLTGKETVVFSLKECITFDSTFMGVMAMMALKTKRQNGTISLFGADPKLCALLRGIGILKLFTTAGSLPDAVPGGAAMPEADAPRSEADRAQTVLDAHKTLVEADQKNAAVFKTVIELAEDDVNRLKNNQ